MLKDAYNVFTKEKIKKDMERAFYGWRGALRSSKSCFRKMTQS